MSRPFIVTSLALALFAMMVLASARPADVMSYPPPMATPTPEQVTVVVVEGDHLWSISEASLRTRLGREAQAEEVSPFWREVIEINRDSLRSGDPDLIYPGEEITLPAG